MKRETSLARIVHYTSLLSLIFFACLVSARAQTTAFTYQGRLTDSMSSGSNSYLMKFELYADAAGNAPIDTLLEFRN